jgi:formate dehydrogenase major subunit
MKAMFIMGHGGNTITRMPEAAKGIEKLDLLVVCDPYPTTWSVRSRSCSRRSGRSRACR